MLITYTHTHTHIYIFDNLDGSVLLTLSDLILQNSMENTRSDREGKSM